jgi:dipeptidyl aminopeptidase/acylaminoacyl peptidase
MHGGHDSGFGRLLMIALLLGLAIESSAAEQHGFTVADDIALSHFGDPYTVTVDPIIFAPNGKYFAVVSERGLLVKSRPESIVRLYKTEDVRQFLNHPSNNIKPSPFWTFGRSTYKDGPIITHLRWLSDSSGVAFLCKVSSGEGQLLLANVESRTINVLTSANQNVVAFDIHNRARFVYAVRSPEIERRKIADRNAPSIVATERDLPTLLFQDDHQYDLSELWAVEDGKRYRVEYKPSQTAVQLYSDGLRALRISPDGRSLVTALPVTIVPAEWGNLYPPPTASSAYHFRAGIQDVGALQGDSYVSQYVRIDLISGVTTTLINAPVGIQAGWWTSTESADWAPDGSAVLLLNAFRPVVSPASDPAENRPCMALVELKANQTSCLDYLTKYGDEQYHLVESAQFVGSSKKIVIHYTDMLDAHRSTSILIRADSGEWSKTGSSVQLTEEHPLIDVVVRQSFKQPPVLVATDLATKSSRVILDPNPQLKKITLGKAALFKWQDGGGQEWTGGLYKPPNYVEGKRYPLVIQTHGFTEFEFRPFGIYPTADAAQELASAGIVVLQTPDCPITISPDEGACVVREYDSAIHKLVEDGVVDADHIGIVGFSRSCYYVLRMLTANKWRFGAASITDGVEEGYMQYLITSDYPGHVFHHETEAMNGARPFGKGLESWLANSPPFNMDRVTAPLQVVSIGLRSLLFMWEPYAALRSLDRPVDLVAISEGTHILTNPAQRMISQGGTVDWFRFWLKGQEDPDPAKAVQYVRWRELRKLQEQNQSNARTN